MTAERCSALASHVAYWIVGNQPRFIGIGTMFDDARILMIAVSTYIGYFFDCGFATHLIHINCLEHTAQMFEAQHEMPHAASIRHTDFILFYVLHSRCSTRSAHFVSNIMST